MGATGWDVWIEIVTTVGLVLVTLIGVLWKVDRRQTAQHADAARDRETIHTEVIHKLSSLEGGQKVILDVAQHGAERAGHAADAASRVENRLDHHLTFDHGNPPPGGSDVP